MKLKTLRLATGLALTAATGISQAASFPLVDARVAGMGGVAIATANLDSAAYYNPALLAAQDKSSDFSFSAAVGVSYADPDNLQGAASNFSDSLTAFTNLDPLTTTPASMQADFNQLQTDLANLGGKAFTVSAPLGANIGFNFGGWAAAVTTQYYVHAKASVVSTDGNPLSITDVNGNPITWADISAITDPTVLSNTLQNISTNGQFKYNGVEGQEIGLSLARKLDVAGLDLSVGLTPKLVSVASGTGTADISSNSTPTLTTSSATSDFNMDAGVVWNVSEDLRVAGSLRNIIGKTYGSYEVKPQLRAGVGYATHLFTVGADMDLTENDTFGTKSRIMAVGAEFNAWSVIQLRAGYRNDLASKLTQYSVGFGLLNSAINVAAIYNPKDTSQGLSAYVGFGVNF